MSKEDKIYKPGLKGCLTTKEVIKERLEKKDFSIISFRATGTLLMVSKKGYLH